MRTWVLLAGLGLLVGCKGSDAPAQPQAGPPPGGLDAAGAPAGDAGGDVPGTRTEGGDTGPSAPGQKVLVYAGGGRRLHVISLDVGTGALTPLASVPAGEDARLFALEPAEPATRVHVQSQAGEAITLTTYAIDGEDGLPEPIDERALPAPMVEGVSQMSRHPTAPWLLISATVNAGLEDQLLPVGSDGRLGEAQPLAREFYAFSWDPSGRFFFGLDMEAIKQFVFDPAAGRLTPNPMPEAEGSAGHVVSALVHQPGGGFVFAVEEQAVGVFAFDPSAGTLKSKGFVPNPTPAQPIYWTSAAVHPGGRFVYVLGYVETTRLLVLDLFAFDPGTGQLRFVRRSPGPEEPPLRNTGLWAPSLVGEFLIVGGERAAAGESGPALLVHRIDPADGSLRPVGAPAPLDPAAESAVNFIFSPGLAAP